MTVVGFPLEDASFNFGRVYFLLYVKLYRCSFASSFAARIAIFEVFFAAIKCVRKSWYWNPEVTGIRSEAAILFLGCAS